MNNKSILLADSIFEFFTLNACAAVLQAVLHETSFWPKRKKTQRHVIIKKWPKSHFSSVI